MAKVALATVGCRLNQYETEKLAVELVGLGLKRVAYNEEADLYILNSCTVTGRADADCRKLINRAYRRNKDAVMVVAGCYVVSEREKIAGMNGVDMVVRNDEKSRLPDMVREKFPHLFNTVEAFDAASGTKSTTRLFGDYSRAMVKIADGCDQGCSYCIVPSVRGRFRSIGAPAVIDEVKSLVDGGYHEVVLTAVHIGKYGYDGMNLAGLADRILKETSLSRLRLSSLEPNELDDHLVEFIAHNPRVCRHLHLPLQSGSNRILKMMRRPYTREEYLAVIERVKSHNEDVTIGCDLIVGFPGEGDDDFRQSLGVLNCGYIDYGHIFSYSDRPGTPAAKLPGKVGSKIIKERNRQARDISHRRRIYHMRRQIGKRLGVISEQKPRKDGSYWGISDNYIKVKLPSGSAGDRGIISFMPKRLAGNTSQTIHLEGDIIA
jgi:threonylcarbamoyladenosine tRNA methylthiotransferase MtaB